MGCGLGKSKQQMQKSIRAAVLIQRWYRRYVARLEIRRRCTWNIFQSIEYAGQQDQIKLYNFFVFLMQHFTPASSESKALETFHCYESIEVSNSYTGPRLTFPLTFCGVSKLVETFKHRQKLHARYVLQLLGETAKLLRILANINHVSTSYTKEITICGDLHGHLEDLLLIFYKNGLPSGEKPYVFNGDFVDRGKNSLEILLILFGFLLVYPHDVHLNRGNHEDHIVNLRYGFTKEVLGKYRVHGKKILKLLKKIFCWLPLATVIDHKVLVVHGGISDATDLDTIARVDRHKMCTTGNSDPMPQNGCIHNEVRGGGCYWGPDVTEEVLGRHGLQLLIRSHECKQDGYEFCHNRRVLTIFSASNYYEVGSNRGAYIKLGPDLVPHVVQYQASQTCRELSLRQSVGWTERSALQALREQLFVHTSHLIAAFQDLVGSFHNVFVSGMVSLRDWASATESVLKLGLPWRVLRPQLVSSTCSGMVDYQQWIRELTITKPNLETMYKNHSNLETIFRIIDTDHSGSISLEEFRQTWKLLCSHIQTEISDDAIDDLAKCIDFNKDGSIDINEFMEAFRLVDLSTGPKVTE
uniref:Serine/threonine-protein phosphatase n=1 Tax=Cynoglossus semilaevis TaxID=244447 RepID=A0A3P8UL11_CYNSE